VIFFPVEVLPKSLSFKSKIMRLTDPVLNALTETGCLICSFRIGIDLFLEGQERTYGN
jgi:hypothetical protein